MKKFFVEMEVPDFFIERDQSSICVCMKENKPWIRMPGGKNSLACGSIYKTTDGIEVVEMHIKVSHRNQTAWFTGPETDEKILEWYRTIVEKEINEGIIPFEAYAKIVNTSGPE